MKTPCSDWLSRYLQQREIVLCETVRDTAKMEGYTKSELRAARTRLGVKTYHSCDDYGSAGSHFWYLPNGN